MTRKKSRMVSITPIFIDTKYRAKLLPDLEMQNVHGVGDRRSLEIGGAPLQLRVGLGGEGYH